MGIHSDMLKRHLPNGWEFYLSNEVYRGAKGEVCEKVGIAPDHPIEMFTPKDFQDGKDQTVVRALKLAESLLAR
jgi:C-terminal processing protease CtpA/Prc